MTTTPGRRSVYYSTSILHTQTPHGFILIGTTDRPVYLRTASGWVEYPGTLPLRVMTAHGWADVVTGG